jgi:hypothetical protein
MTAPRVAGDEPSSLERRPVTSGRTTGHHSSDGSPDRERRTFVARMTDRQIASEERPSLEG